MINGVIESYVNRLRLKERSVLKISTKKWKLASISWINKKQVFLLVCFDCHLQTGATHIYQPHLIMGSLTFVSRGLFFGIILRSLEKFFSFTNLSGSLKKSLITSY